MILKLLLVGLFCTAWTAEEGPIVITNYGKIQGFMSKSQNDKEYYTFHNIPFAKPPIGALRLKFPEEPESWEDVRDGVEPHNVCPQNLFDFQETNETMSMYVGQEDCLYLSIYTPKLDGELLPVMFFIHGGGFFSGAGLIYKGSDLVDHNVVMVSINYRLGVLGFLSTEDDVIPGNMGMMDQTIALNWVKDNIEHFGGDPGQVTIFGESAGSAAVHYHILSPASKGLFHRAILQSGTALSPWARSRDNRGIAIQVGGAMGCFSPTGNGRKQSYRLLKCLQKVDEKTLASVYEKFMNFNFSPIIFSPFVDGKYLPNDPEILMKEGNHNPVDIIIGVNKDEGGLGAYNIFKDSSNHKKLQQDFEYYGPISIYLSYEDDAEVLTKKVYEHYLNKITVDIEDLEELNQMYGDNQFKVPTDIVAKMHRNKVYLYEFAYRGTQSIVQLWFKEDIKMNWVSHADDLLYLFPTVEMGFGLDKLDAKDEPVKDNMIKMWTNFARTGNPTPDDSMDFKWEPFTKENPKQLLINSHPEMQDFPREKVDEFWSSLPTRANRLLYGSNTKDEL